MPDQSAHLSDFYKGGHQLRCFMSVVTGTLVMEGEILDPLIQNIELLFNVISGSTDDIRPGFRVDIVTSDGRFKGRTRVSYGGATTEHSIYIRETSAGSIDIQVGDHVRVYREMRLSDKLPSSALIEPFAPDFIHYTDQGSNPPPLPTSGGAWAGWTRMLPAVMTGSDSATVDPDSTSDPTHDWSETDGLTLSSGMDSDPDIEFSGAAGSYLPAHVVTDPDNGKSITQYVPVVIHDKAHPPYKVVIEDLPNEETKGGSARVRMLQNATLAAVPDGSLVILWKEEFIAGARQSFGARAPGRSHILFVGYLRREEGSFDASTGVEGLTFDVISPLARLDELMGYSKVMLNNASPDSWNKMKALTVRRGMIQLPMFYSNALECFDWVFTGTFQDYDYPGLFLDTSTPLAQVRELAEGDDGRVIEDRRGRFEVQMQPELLALADRDDLPITLTIAARAIKSWKYTREHWRPVNRLQLNAFIAGYSNNPTVFSEWPGPSPGEGNQTSTIDKIIASSQANANERAGRRGAAADGIYVDADGVQQMALDLELVLRGAFDLFDFYDELTAIDVTANRRGIDFNGMKYVFIGSSVSFPNGTAETTVRFRTCTNGAAGSTYTPPTSDVAPYTPPSSVPQPFVPPASRFPVVTGQVPLGGIAISAAEAKASWVTSFDQGTQTLTWASRSTGKSGTGGPGYSNPFDYDTFYNFSSAGLEILSHQSSDGSYAWTNPHSLTDLYGMGATATLSAHGSHLVNGWGMALGNNGYRAITNDGWQTFTIYAGSYNNFWICGHDPNHLMAAGTSGNLTVIYYSSDGGITFSSLATFAGTWLGHDSFWTLFVQVPYLRHDKTPNVNDANMEIINLWYDTNDGGTHGGAYRWRKGDAAAINAAIGAADFTTWLTYLTFYTGDPCNGEFTFSMNTWNPLSAIWGEGIFGGGSQAVTTNDGGATSTVRSTVDSIHDPASFNGWPLIDNDDPSVGVWVGFGSNGLSISFDNGATFWGSPPGDWSSGSTSYFELALVSYIPT